MKKIVLILSIFFLFNSLPVTADIIRMPPNSLRSGITNGYYQLENNKNGELEIKEKYNKELINKNKTSSKNKQTRLIIRNKKKNNDESNR